MVFLMPSSNLTFGCQSSSLAAFDASPIKHITSDEGGRFLISSNSGEQSIFNIFATVSRTSPILTPLPVAKLYVSPVTPLCAALIKPSTVSLTKLKSLIGFKSPNFMVLQESACRIMVGMTALADCLTQMY